MSTLPTDDRPAREAAETEEWLESLEEVLRATGPERTARLLQDLSARAVQRGVHLPSAASTPFVNTIPADRQVPLPGNRELERRVKNLVRWNAIAMVVRANLRDPGIGGHISTFASAATLFEVGFNHFFRTGRDGTGRDIVFFQGHASPGIYARGFLEGRITAEQLENFRHELQPGRGLSSYPHPWLMSEFWEYPTVSMGLSPLMAIYQARFIRYLEDRGLMPPSGTRVWAFIGDGETDEPEALGAITLPAREKLDNLIFVVNCNLQRLDGPVRGNGQIIRELEAVFRGAGWNVIKVLWGQDWDPLLANDRDGLLVRRMGETLDGQYQKYAVEPGSYVRRHFWGADPRLLDLVRDMTDEELRHLTVGGHDPVKVYNAFKSAVEHKGAPTVILARTIKGHGLGSAGEARNITHQQKKLNEEELRAVRTRLGVPIADSEVAEAPFYRPPPDSPEMRYLRERREALGGYLPSRTVRGAAVAARDAGVYTEFHAGTGGRPVSTTMALVRLLSLLLRDRDIGRLIVPIVPDEARTFGMDPLFRQVGIYSHAGQLYEPVDRATLLYYRESVDGAILEEGITEAGALASFIAAGTAYATHGVNTIPFFVFYSMFGFQRVGDLIWAAADARCRGFLVGATSGRTTLAGEGLQHQDGQSHLLAYPVPNLVAYDPAFAHELAVIVEDGLRRMYAEQENVFYYLTVTNEPYAMPAMPEGARPGILKGLYRFSRSPDGSSPLRAQLLASGALVPEAIRSQDMLAQYGVAADVWSVTSWGELHRDGHACERWNMLHPLAVPRVPYVTQCLGEAPGVIVAVSDYVKALPDSIARWLPGPVTVLGTDGFGRSGNRAELRGFFEVDARFMTLAALSALARQGQIGREVVRQAARDLGIDPERPNPVSS